MLGQKLIVYLTSIIQTSWDYLQDYICTFKIVHQIIGSIIVIDLITFSQRMCTFPWMLLRSVYNVILNAFNNSGNDRTYYTLSLVLMKGNREEQSL